MRKETEKISNTTTRRRRKPLKILGITVVILAVLLVAGLVLVPVMIMPSFLGQRYEQEQYDSLDFGITSERIALQTDDGLSLAAWRTQAVEPKGTVVILSGIQNPSVTAFFGYAKWLSDNGWDALLIEMRARSLSEGEEIGFGMTEWYDAKAGVDFLTADERAGNLPIVTMGTSMGGATVLIAAGELPEVDAVISLSAYSTCSSVFVEFMAMGGIPKFLSVMDLPFVNLFLGFHYGWEALDYTPVNGLAKLGERPLLMMHSTGDTQVPYSEFEKLMKVVEKQGTNVTTFIREGDEHFICYEPYFDDPAQDTEFSQAILSFLEKVGVASE